MLLSQSLLGNSELECSLVQLQRFIAFASSSLCDSTRNCYLRDLSLCVYGIIDSLRVIRNSPRLLEYILFPKP
uniref:Putative ovule protein n=1 Tax=Solanum chacoense TaxID=4108 RepID=A0A0V0GVQ4_SOLCH